MQLYFLRAGPLLSGIIHVFKKYLEIIHLVTEERYVPLDNEDAEGVLDILNTFVPIDPQGEPVEDDKETLGAVKVEIIYVDLYREFWVIDNSIVINHTKYTGTPGCLEPLYKVFRESDEVILPKTS